VCVCVLCVCVCMMCVCVCMNRWGQQGFGNWSTIIQCNVYALNGTLLTSVVTDKAWTQTLGPIVYDDVYNGEVYDARRELVGWTKAG